MSKNNKKVGKAIFQNKEVININTSSLTHDDPLEYLKAIIDNTPIEILGDNSYNTSR